MYYQNHSHKTPKIKPPNQNKQKKPKKNKDHLKHKKNTGQGFRNWYDDDFGLTGWRAFINRHIWGLEMCYDKTERVFWKIHICETCYRFPLMYCLGCCCSCCFAFYQRELILGPEMQTRYSCCQGACGKCYCTRCIRMVPCLPHICLFLESFICTGCTIDGNRRAMQFFYPVENTLLEEILLCIGCVLSCFNIYGALIGCLTAGCLNAQQEKEYSSREKHTGLLPYCDWGKAPPGVLYKDCWRLQPCCPDILGGVYCCVCWSVCGLCSISHLLAYTNDRECRVVNHLGPYLLVGLLFMIPLLQPFSLLLCAYLNGALRHNGRVQTRTGNSEHCFGDAMIGNFLCPCSLCQVLRSVPVEGWDWLKSLREKKIGLIEFKDFCNYVKD